ncbi:hypothetical protein Mapa_012828 [Marchantia paleacea]|nr:hypothetical protein Mapa_012828 [Marchantia paleacea]
MSSPSSSTKIHRPCITPHIFYPSPVLRPVLLQTVSPRCLPPFHELWEQKHKPPSSALVRSSLNVHRLELTGGAHAVRNRQRAAEASRAPVHASTGHCNFVHTLRSVQLVLQQRDLTDQRCPIVHCNGTSFAAQVGRMPMRARLSVAPWHRGLR